MITLKTSLDQSVPEKQMKVHSQRPVHTMALTFDGGASYGYKLAPLLDSGLPVLIYNGDQDYICNWMGGVKWTDALVW